MPLRIAFIALGANLSSSTGSPTKSLVSALQQIDKIAKINIMRASRFFRTPAYPAGAGPDYVNACAVLETSLDPHQLLAALHQIERDMGRIRDGARWKSREIDLDLLAYDDLVLPDRDQQKKWRSLSVQDQMTLAPEELILPHPRMQDRSFVLVPLAEIAPDWCHPITGQSVILMRDALPAADRHSARAIS